LSKIATITHDLILKLCIGADDEKLHQEQVELIVNLPIQVSENLPLYNYQNSECTLWEKVQDDDMDRIENSIELRRRAIK
jgi:hypothetical protein